MNIYVFVWEYLSDAVKIAISHIKLESQVKN